jgi:hypothetical protein
MLIQKSYYLSSVICCGSLEIETVTRSLDLALLHLLPLRPPRPQLQLQQTRRVKVMALARRRWIRSQLCFLPLIFVDLDSQLLLAYARIQTAAGCTHPV